MFNTKPNGQDIIAKSIGSFEKVVQDLDHGIKLCIEEEIELEEQIQDLTSSRNALEYSKAKALKVRDNILKMIDV